MDPTANLREQIELARSIIGRFDANNGQLSADAQEEIAYIAEELARCVCGTLTTPGIERR